MSPGRGPGGCSRTCDNSGVPAGRGRAACAVRGQPRQGRRPYEREPFRNAASAALRDRCRGCWSRAAGAGAASPRQRRARTRAPCNATGGRQPPRSGLCARRSSRSALRRRRGPLRRPAAARAGRACRRAAAPLPRPTARGTGSLPGARPRITAGPTARRARGRPGRARRCGPPAMSRCARRLLPERAGRRPAPGRCAALPCISRVNEDFLG